MISMPREVRNAIPNVKSFKRKKGKGRIHILTGQTAQWRLGGVKTVLLNSNFITFEERLFRLIEIS